jgi:hypothetical protein
MILFRECLDRTNLDRAFLRWWNLLGNGNRYITIVDIGHLFEKFMLFVVKVSV